MSGGLRHASAAVSSNHGDEGVYGLLKLEGGVHRVQRVPRTEKAGRMHTSTVTVSVLPQPTEVSFVHFRSGFPLRLEKENGDGKVILWSVMKI